MKNKITLNLSTPESAENFIWAVRENKRFKSAVFFILSASQRQELRRLRREAKRPNETPLNLIAFIAVLASGSLIWLLSSIASISHLTSSNLTFVTMGIFIVTMAGALVVLGLPTRSNTSSRLLKINLECEPAVIEPLKKLAADY